MYNIMVVDDEKDIVKAIEIYLKTDNYNVLKAYNGYDALELMEKNKIDLFLVDIMMEGMDGLELTQKNKRSIKCTNHNFVCKKRIE